MTNQTENRPGQGGFQNSETHTDFTVLNIVRELRELGEDPVDLVSSATGEVSWRIICPLTHEYGTSIWWLQDPTCGYKEKHTKDQMMSAFRTKKRERDAAEEAAKKAQQDESEQVREHAGDKGLSFISLADLCAEVDAQGPRKWLLRGVWPAGDYGVHAAEMKAQKTWNTVDVAVSVASGTPWLGSIEVDTQGPVLMLAGEGSRSNLVRRIRGVCASRDLKAEDLPIVICTRAPHLDDAVHRGQIAEQLLAVKPVLVTLDPLYLAARGASGSNLYEMGERLETVQLLCQAADASLWVVHHHNRATGRTGAMRISGAGAAEWGRVLITAEVKKRQKDAETKQTIVTTKLDIIGGEVADQDYTVTRTIRAEDPDNLDSPFFYAVRAEQESDEDDRKPFRPTWLMEQISKLLNKGAEKTQTEIVESVGKRKKDVLEALDILQDEGFVACEKKGRSKVYTSRHPYSQALDPKSDKYAGNPDSSEEWSA